MMLEMGLCHRKICRSDLGMEQNVDAGRKRIWGWYFFDWASQPYNTLLLTFIFGPYFAEVARAYFTAQGAEPVMAAAQAQAYWSSGLTITGILIALLSPVVGAIASGTGRIMVWIWAFSAFYVAGSLMVWWCLPQMPSLFWPVFWFSLGFIGMEMATNLTNALMPDLTGDENMGKISGSGFAFGYAGGVLSLFIVLLFFAESGTTGKTFIGLDPLFGLDAAQREGTRSVGPFTAIWYVIFMVPFFLWVREPKHRVQRRTISQSLSGLKDTIAGLKHRKSLAFFLIGSMFFRDALNSVYALGGSYASNAMDFTVVQSGIFGIVAAISAAFGTYFGGRIDQRRGPKLVIVLSILCLIGVLVVMVGMSPAGLYSIRFAEGSSTGTQIVYLCGVVIGAMGGTLQASSRTIMVFHTDHDRAAADFGLYCLSGKATAFLAPALITWASLTSGSPQIGITPLIPLFLIGLVLLIWVKPTQARGQ